MNHIMAPFHRAVILIIILFAPICHAEQSVELSSVLLPFDDLLKNTEVKLPQPSTEDRRTLYQPVFDQALKLAESHPKKLVTVLLTALAETDHKIYYPATYILRIITAQNHGYQAYSSAKDRLESRGSWLEWWMINRSNFTSQAAKIEGSTLIVDEIPGRLIGNDDEPPGCLLHLDAAGNTIVDVYSLKMPYDAVRNDDATYFVNIIRARSVFHVDANGAVSGQIPVGGYPCSLQVLDNGNLLVAGWDDDVPGFVREFDLHGNIVWQIESLQRPWKAERLNNGNTFVADAGSKRIFEIDSKGSEIWAVEDLGPEKTELFDQLGPVYVQRLADGNTLVSISGTSEIIELNRKGEAVWGVGKELVLNQYSAERLWNGNTFIADAGHFRVIEINVDKEIIWKKEGLGYPSKAYRY